LALQVCFPGFVLGLVLFVAVLAALAPLVALLCQHLPRFEPFVVLGVGAAAIATCLLDFYVLLPTLSVYSFRLVDTGELLRPRKGK
jgi:hypothetical protein